MRLHLTQDLLAPAFQSLSYRLTLPHLGCILVYHKVWPHRHKVITKIPQRLDQFHPIPIQNHLIRRGSQTACICKLDYHVSCTLCKGSAVYL
jgi:hypothetical protein